MKPKEGDLLMIKSWEQLREESKDVAHYVAISRALVGKMKEHCGETHRVKCVYGHSVMFEDISPYLFDFCLLTEPDIVITEEEMTSLESMIY